MKGTREFSIQIFNDSKYSILDTPIHIMRDVYKDDHGVTGNLGQINIDQESADTFSYTQDNKEIMAAALMHNSIPYLFKYETLKQNFDKDTDTMLKFFGSVEFPDQ